jgi:hypothetical protein
MIVAAKQFMVFHDRGQFIGTSRYSDCFAIDYN